MDKRKDLVSRDIRCAAEILRGSKTAVALTGAGVSTPSGIPDFRSSKSGLWEKYDPFEYASLLTFRHHPEKLFNWMRPLIGQIMNAEPNPAHRALAEIESAGILRTLVTQNIDNLHQLAGSQNVLEVHGSFRTLTCGSCFQRYPSEEFLKPYIEHGAIPTCRVCAGVLKPDIVLMGEQLPIRTWKKAQKACQECDAMIVAGSSLEVMPVAGLPMLAVENGAHLIIVNQTPTYIDVRADVVFNGDVADIIPLIAREVLGD